MTFVGNASLERAIHEYVEHYHAERPHQGLKNTMIRRSAHGTKGAIHVSERLGGLLKYYYRLAV